MPSKSNTSYQILKKTGVVVKLKKDPEEFNKDKASLQEGETFKQWKLRVFGDSSIDLDVYFLSKPAPQTKMASLKRDGGGSYIKKIFSEFGEYKEGVKEKAVKETKKEARKAVEITNKEAEARFLEFPSELLQSFLDAHRTELDDSLIGFVENLVKSHADSMDTQQLIRAILLRYNNEVKRLKK